MAAAALHKPAATGETKRWDVDPVLTVEHLTMRFGGLVAINDLSFNVGRGDITALIGPNGAGKTTVFNCVTGFYKPTEGRIVMRHGPGRQQDAIDRLTAGGLKSLKTPEGGVFLLERMPDFEISHKARVARTFQNIRLFGGMTVLENLLVAQHNVLMKASSFTLGGIIGLPGFRKAESEAIDRAVYWLEQVRLIDRADDPAADLPYGAQRRLEIARAMCTGPQLLCLDEPAAGLNPRESAELNELLQYIRANHDTSILLIEHDMGVVMEISDHIVVLDYGVKISDGDADFVRNDPSVIAAYLGVEDEEIEAVPEVASLVVEALGEETAKQAGIEPPATEGDRQ
jgi:branched-chain amino acid transport system ATP-binding protein